MASCFRLGTSILQMTQHNRRMMFEGVKSTRQINIQKGFHHRHNVESKHFLKPARLQGNLNILRRFRPNSSQGATPPRLEGAQQLWRPLGFTFLVCGSSFTACTIWQYESLRNTVNRYQKHGYDRSETFRIKAGSFRNQLNSWWQSLTPGKKVVACIISINCVVFALWRVPALTPVMTTYFTSSPASAAPCLSMLFSTFSQFSFLHLAANMYVLWSFSNAVTGLLGREQFTAMYLSAGMVSALASHAAKTLRGRALVPSLGASGAIMAILGVVCTQYPDSRLSIAFVGEIYPHSFSAGSAMKCLIGMDLAGVLLGWKVFDHAAHLGGILFGIWYIKYGHKYIWGKREPFLKLWHKIRGKPS